MTRPTDEATGTFFPHLLCHGAVIFIRKGTKQQPALIRFGDPSAGDCRDLEEWW